MARRRRKSQKRSKKSFKFENPLFLKVKVKPALKKHFNKRNLILALLAVGLIYWNPLAVPNLVHEATSFLTKPRQTNIVPSPISPKPKPVVKSKPPESAAAKPKTQPVKPAVSKKEPYVYYKVIYPETGTYSSPVPVSKPAPVTGAIPQTFSRKPKLTFVLDDLGHTNADQGLLERLGNNVTYAILPHLKHSKDFGNLSRRTGADVILHLPLESQKGTIPGPGLITDRMSASQIREMVRRNMDSIPNLIGVNNHMGSKGTSDPELMRIILEELDARGFFFLDSFTTASSVVPQVARQVGIPVVRRDIFLDNEDSQEAVRREVRKMAAIARSNGTAIGIGHYRYNTLKVLNEEIPRLQSEGFEIVTLSQLVSLKN